MNLSPEKIKKPEVEKDVILCSDCGNKMGDAEKGTGTSHGVCPECQKLRAKGDPDHMKNADKKSDAGQEQRDAILAGVMGSIISKIEECIDSSSETKPPSEILQSLIEKYGKVINVLLKEEEVELTISTTKEDLKRILTIIEEKASQSDNVLPFKEKS